jgi:two-component system cell cycle sensor histidine kinase PleC
LFVLPPLGLGPVEVFQFAAMLIVVAVGVMLASNIPPAMVGFTGPIAVATAISFVSRGDQAADGGIPYTYAMGAMAIGVLVFFLILGYRLYNSALAMIESRAEKDALIAELEQAKAISDESRRKAEEANLAKSRFLATMSHELRTPLNAILGFSEVIKNEMLGPVQNATYKDYVSDIHASGQHLLNLINEILDISRVEAGRYKLNEEAVTLLFCVEDCVHMMKLRAKNKGLTIIEQYEDNLPKVWADERAMRQIVLNILSNAVKFTPAGGSITVKVGWTAGGGQYVNIKDTGPGIPEEEIPVVLSAFGQGSIAIKSAEQGTGLGLNIVQALVAMHEGSFDLKSKLREGTEITFTIPSNRVLEVMPAIEERKTRRPIDDNYTAKIWSAPKRQRA